jgi:hypothetical protein
MPKDFDQTEHLREWDPKVLHQVQKNTEKLLAKEHLRLKHCKNCNILPREL